MSKEEYQFDGVEMMQRNLEAEGKTGTEVWLPNGIVLTVLAAGDGNPRWRQRWPEIRAEVNRMTNALAPPEKHRHYLARIYAETLVIGWRGVKSKGVEIPFSVDACTAFLRNVYDAYMAVDAIVYDTKNFRGQRIEAVVDEGKD